MFFAGFLVLLAGVWIADSAYHGRPPLSTLTKILQDPQNMTAILDQTKGTSTHTAMATLIPSGTPSAIGGAPGGKLPSGNAGGVVSFLEAQVGKPYRWGATGPNAFDCSGLGYAAYKSIGVKIPRTSQLQALAGKFVSRKNLQPGDAVFPYYPYSHVMWYVGNGVCVEASVPGQPIHYTKVYSFVVARRYLS